MAESTVTLTAVDFWDDGKRVHVLGTIAIGADPGTYTTGGIALNPLTKLGGQVPGINTAPVKFSIDGIAGYKYEFDSANNKLLIRSAGAVAAHTHDLKIIGGQAAASTAAVATYATDILGKEAATDVTIAGADSATKGGVISSGAVSADALAELAAAAMPAGVSGDTIQFEAIFKKLI